ncbi:MAG: hypothetical protein ACHQT6_01255 [Candidatus Acidiferrales bacterium]
MIVRVRHLLRNPLFLLTAIALLTAVLVQSGELGSSDTTHRLHATHSFWTSDPPVFPDEYPGFGIPGRGGKLHGWYGIGQSLLMLPSDVLGTYLDNLPVFADYRGTDPNVRDIVVSYSTNILLCVLTCLVCFRFLGLFDFTVNQRIAGVLALLFGTTFLYYTQDMTENNYIALLTLSGLTFQYEWFRSGKRWALVLGSAALGANLLTRLTTGMDVLAVCLFLLLTAWLTNVRGRELRSRAALYARIALPIYGVFVLLDRAYQYFRFGSFFNTYMQIFGQEWKRLNPSLPAAFPFETPFHVGFFGALFTPEKSIFLFDPLLVLVGIVTVFAWKHFRPEVRAYFVAFGALLFAYVSFYAKFTDWSGDTAWGDRYVATAAQFVALMAVPLLLRHRTEVGKVVWRVGLAIMLISVVIQLGSVAFWCPLERYQMDTLSPPTFVVWLRLKNIVAFTLGKMSAWGLTNEAMQDDPWDYVHITTWNFLPFLLKRVGKAPASVVEVLKALWLTVLVALIALLGVASRLAAKRQFDLSPTGQIRPSTRM